MFEVGVKADQMLALMHDGGGEPGIGHVVDLSHLGVKFDPKRACHLEYGREARISIGAECPIQTFATEPGILGDLGHSFCTRDVAKGSGNPGGIIRRLV